jgi:hypothetical protein
MLGLRCSWAFWLRTTSLRPKIDLGPKTTLGHKIIRLGSHKCEDGTKMMQQKLSTSQLETKTKGKTKRDGIVVNKPTLALKKKKKKKNRWLTYFAKNKLVRKSNFRDACGSWEEHKKSSRHPFIIITILSLPQLHMVVAPQ